MCSYLTCVVVKSLSMHHVWHVCAMANPSLPPSFSPCLLLVLTPSLAGRGLPKWLLWVCLEAHVGVFVNTSGRGMRHHALNMLPVLQKRVEWARLRLCIPIL